MNKTERIIIVLAIIALLCSSFHSMEYRKVDPMDISYFVDPVTGVNYIVYSCSMYHGGAGGITPRLNADGTPMVTKE